MYPNPLSAFSVAFEKILLSTFKYRDRATIIGNILDTIYRDPKGKTKTSIMRSTNLNFDQANKYLGTLVMCDILRAADPLKSQELARYRLTEKGVVFLKNFNMWQMVLETFRNRIM
jgi:predicted transcriptional regulator